MFEWSKPKAQFPEARPRIAQFIASMTQEAQGIPSVQHLAPRRTKPGTLDLTASTLFVGAVEKHALICAYARELQKLIPFRHAHINLGTALEMFLTALFGLHRLWRQTTCFSPSDLTQAGLVRCI